MGELQQAQIWFLTGSQHLYGPEALEQVGGHAREIVGALNESAAIPAQIVYRPVLTTPEEVLAKMVAELEAMASSG